MGILLLTACLWSADPVVAAPPEVGKPDVVADAMGDQKELRKQAKWSLVQLWALLALLSIVLLFVGAMMLTVRLGRRIRRMPRPKRTKYFDLTIPPEPEPPPHELSAEERGLGGNPKDGAGG